MPDMCVVGGCSNKSSDGVSMHRFPCSENRRRLWIKFVQLTRSNFEHYHRNSICSKHFEDSCLIPLSGMMQDVGYSMRRLTDTAIPTIKTPIATPPSPKKGKTSSDKRHSRRCVGELLQRSHTGIGSLSACRFNNKRGAGYKDMENSSSSTPQNSYRTILPRCSIPGCKVKNTSTHYFPKDKERCMQWVTFVKKHNPDFNQIPWSCICGAHFEMKCFTPNVVLEKIMGCHRMRHNLTEEAVPTLFDPSLRNGDEQTTTAEIIPSTSTATGLPRGAVYKLSSVPSPDIMKVYKIAFSEMKPSTATGLSLSVVDKLCSVPSPDINKIYNIAFTDEQTTTAEMKPSMATGPSLGAVDKLCSVPSPDIHKICNIAFTDEQTNTAEMKPSMATGPSLGAVDKLCSVPSPDIHEICNIAFTDEQTTTAEMKSSMATGLSLGAVDKLCSVPSPDIMRICNIAVTEEQIATADMEPSAATVLSPGAVGKLCSVPSPDIMKAGKIAPKKTTLREVRPRPNVFLKGKLFGPFNQSQTPFLLLPQGSSPSPGVSRSTTTNSTNLAVSQPVTISSDNQMSQKPMTKTTAQSTGGSMNVITQKQIFVKKKVILKKNIISIPVKKETSLTMKKTTLTLQQLKIMSSEDLVSLFSCRVKIGLSKNYALRCKMEGNCPFVISCPSEYDCKSVMNLHLKKHIDWWIAGSAGSMHSKKPRLQIKIKKFQELNYKNIPCISETTEEEPERNENLQTAFKNLCQTIADEMNQITVERDRIEALLKNEPGKNVEEMDRGIGNRIKMGSDRIDALLREANNERRKQEERKRKLTATCQESPRKHLIPEHKLKIMNKEKSSQDAESMNLMLRPLTRLANPPRILARSRKPVPADELDMPVITAVRGSVQRDEEGDGMESKINNTMFNIKRITCIDRGPSPLGIANEMIAKAKAVFDKISSSDSRVSEGLPSPDLDSESILRPFVAPSSPALEKSFNPPRLSDLANKVLLNEFEMELPSPQSSEKEFDTCENIESDYMSSGDSDSGSLEPPPDDDDDIMQGIHECEQSEKNITPDLEIVAVHIPIPCCRKKETFLFMLGLQKIAHVNMSQDKVQLGLKVLKPLFRTRLQKKAAILQKFYKKRHAAMAPKRLEVKLKPVKIEPPEEIPETVFENQISNENPESDPVPHHPARRSSRHNIKNRSLLSKLKRSVKSNLLNGASDIVGYQVRRADLLKKRAREQTKLVHIKKEFVPDVMNDDCTGVWPENNDAQDFERDEPYNLVSTVVRMPEEGMLEVYKDDQKLIHEMEGDEAERKMRRQIKILRRKREKLTEARLKKEEEEQKIEETRRGSIPVKELLPPEKLVLKRKFTVIPNRVLKISKNLKKNPSSREIVVNGTVVTIKQESSLDEAVDEEHDSDVESFDEGGYSSEENLEPERKKAKLSVAALLLQRRRRREVNFSSDNKADDGFDSTDSEKGKNENTSDDDDDESLDEEELDWDLNLGHISFYEKRDHSSLPDKTGTEICGEAEELSAVEQDAKETHKNSSEHSESNNQDTVKRANYSPPSSLSETELRIREKALEYLRRLKILERQRNQMVEAGETLPERDTKFITCNICLRNFNSLSSIYYHYRSHAGVKPFKCDICFKSFTRLHSLNYHKMIHADTTRFQCGYCGKGFRHPSHYKEHLNKHTGEEPFKCRECNRCFRTSNSLRRHLRRQHGLKTTVRIGDHMPTIKELERVATTLSPPASPQTEMRSMSPPLPQSPPETESVPSKHFETSNMRPIRLTLFPKNGFSRVCFADEETLEQK